MQTESGDELIELLQKLDPTLAAAISTITAALATAILRYSAFHWPRGYHKKGIAERNEITNDDMEEND